MNTSEVLYGAADHIRVFGHWKGDGFGPGSPSVAAACSIGAINIASGGCQNDAINAFHHYLGGSVVAWNDAPERTAEEVIEAMRAAAVVEAARESAPASVAVSA